MQLPCFENATLSKKMFDHCLQMMKNHDKYSPCLKGYLVHINRIKQVCILIREIQLLGSCLGI